MTDPSEELAMAEKYLHEMLEADDTANYDLYTRRYEEKYLVNFSCGYRNGHLQKRRYLVRNKIGSSLTNSDRSTVS